MLRDQPLRPLVRWDGAHLVFDRAAVERRFKHRLEASDRIEDVTFGGSGDTLRLEADILWKGMRPRVALEAGELRLRRRRLGFRVRRLSVLGGVPIPRFVVARILTAAAGDTVSYFSDADIVVVDLRQWLPEPLSLSVLTVQVTERTVDLWLGPGSLRDLPGATPKALPTGAEAAVDSNSELG